MISSASMRLYLFVIAFIVFANSMANAEVTTFECEYKDTNFEFVVTIYEDGSPARIGVEKGVGNTGEAFFDDATMAIVVVEYFANGTLPFALTTILPDGTSAHSRHTLASTGDLLPAQFFGTCQKREIS